MQTFVSEVSSTESLGFVFMVGYLFERILSNKVSAVLMLLAVGWDKAKVDFAATSVLESWDIVIKPAWKVPVMVRLYINVDSLACFYYFMDLL